MPIVAGIPPIRPTETADLWLEAPAPVDSEPAPELLEGGDSDVEVAFGEQQTEIVEFFAWTGWFSFNVLCIFGRHFSDIENFLEKGWNQIQL